MEKIMEYDIDALDADSGIFSAGHEKLAKKFKSLSEKRVKDGWILHSYSTDIQGKSIYATAVWKKE